MQLWLSINWFCVINVTFQKYKYQSCQLTQENRLFLVMWHFQLHFVVQFSKRGRKNMETWKSILSVCCCLLTTLGRKVVFLIRPKSSVLIRVCNASSTLVEPYKREIQCRYFVSYRKSCCIHYNTRNTTSTLSLLKNKWKAFSSRIICAMQYRQILNPLHKRYVMIIHVYANYISNYSYVFCQKLSIPYKKTSCRQAGFFFFRLFSFSTLRSNDYNRIS